MPVDPCFTAILADPRNAVRPPPAHVPAERFRRAANAGLLAASTKPVGAAGAVPAADLVLSGPGGELRARLYNAPTGAERPVVVFLHGGGFVFGDLDTHDGLCRALAAESGAAILAVAYRLAPEARFPAPVEDASAALRWVAEHGREHGLDAGRIAVCGDSAGGSLALAAALRARERGPSLRHVALLYPALDPGCGSASQETLADGYLMTRDALRWFWAAYLGPAGDRADPLTAPLGADLSGLPPVTVATAEYDPLRDEGEALAAALGRAGVPVTGRLYAGMIHGFASFSDLTPVAAAAIRDVAGDLRASLADASAPAA